MSKIDWDKAPEGATHYCAKGSSHNGLEYGEHWLKPGFYRLPHWKKWEEDKCRAPESILVARPSPPWSGEGLPPVGSACELSKPVLLAGVEESREFPAGTIVEVGGHAQFKSSIVPVCVIRAGSTHFTGTVTSGLLRPIRTPEQIAADEREKFAEELTRAMAMDGRPRSMEQARRMYDLGYRKP